jgi:beta-lactamase regulating signal transducer with metallopeptidase domain
MNLMIEYSLRATLVFALAFAVTRMLRRQPAAFRHVIWICAFIIAAATPVFLQFGPRIQIERPAAAPGSVNFQPSRLAAHGGSDSFPPLAGRGPAPHREIPYLEIVWIAGVFLVGTRMWNARRKARSLLKNAVVLQSLSGAESVRIAETDAVATAMTLGVFRPWILLPREHRRWEPELLRAVLLHELAHVRRRDCLVQWLPNVVCAVHWFNPLVWLARSEMLCESERACDDAVIRSGMSGSAFARDLYRGHDETRTADCKTARSRRQPQAFDCWARGLGRSYRVGPPGADSGSESGADTQSSNCQFPSPGDP